MDREILPKFRKKILENLAQANVQSVLPVLPVQLLRDLSNSCERSASFSSFFNHGPVPYVNFVCARPGTVIDIRQP